MNLITKFWGIIGIICLVGLFSFQKPNPNQWVAVAEMSETKDGIRDYVFYHENRIYFGLKNYKDFLNANGCRVVCVYEQSVNFTPHSPKRLVVIIE